ncbi:MAG: hypothetical protein JXA60_12225, partial [Candidatus Coatesbacteria bacterium]|nr:hypothetical protein [Candidatus Coatesbacteria bacterium]
MDKRINIILSISLFLSGLIAFPALIYAIRISFYYSGYTLFTSISLPFLIIIGFISGLSYWGKKSDTSKDILRLYIISQCGFLIWWLCFEQVLRLINPIYIYIGQAAFKGSPGLSILKIIWISLIIIPFCFFISSNIILFTRYIIKLTQDFKKVIIEAVCIYFFSSCLGLLVYALLVGSYYFTFKLYYIATSLLYLVIIVGLTLLRSTWAHPAILKRELDEGNGAYSSKQAFSQAQKKMILIACLMLGWVLGACLILWQKLFSIILFSNQITFILINTIFLLSLGIGCILNFKGSTKIQSVLPGWGVTSFISSLCFMLSLILYPRLPYWIEHINHWFYHTRITFYFINAFIFLLLSSFIIPPVSLLVSGFIKTVDLMTINPKAQGASLSRMINYLLWGSIAGIFLTQILVVPSWGIKKAFFLNVIMSFLFGVLLLFSSPVWKKRYKTLLSFSVLAIIIVFLYMRSPWVSLGLWSTNIHSQWQSIEFKAFINNKEKRNVVFHKDDIIQNYMLIENENKKEDGEYELFINGIRQINFNNKNLSSAPVLLSTIPNMFIESNNTLVLGDRSGLIEYSLSFLANRNVDFVSPYSNIFQKISKITNLSLNSSQNKFNHFKEDEFTYLMWNKNKYDIIIMDSRIIWQLGQDRFYSREFYKEASKHISEKGFLAQLVSSRWIDRRIFDIILTNAIEEF